MKKSTVLGLVVALLVGTATKSNESINTNYNLEQLIFNSEPIKIELIDSAKIKLPEIKESPKYSGSRRLDKETVDEFINFIYKNMKISGVIDKKFVKSIIEAESERYVYAKSKMGARGLMQLIPETWNLLEESDYYKEAFNPLENLKVGIKYLNHLNNDYFQKLYPEWKELPTKDKQLMIAAAYNGGIGRLIENNWDINKMPEETQLYVKKIEQINS